MALFFIITIATVILEIVIVIKFFEMSSDVRKLKSHFCDFETLNADTARIAILKGTTDDLYKTIIEKTYLIIMQGRNENKAAVSGKIAAASNLCQMIGRELPAEIQSIEAFDKFTKADESR